MKMKKIIILIAAAVAAVSCAKTVSLGTNELAKKYFDAWASQHCEGIPPTALGSYVLSYEDGDGVPVGDSLYLRCKYTLSDLDGTISSTSEVSVAQQLGTYDPTYAYEPAFWYRGDNYLYAGIEEILEGGHVGLKARAAIPGWLLTSSRYDTAEEYVENVTGTDGIYEFEVIEAFGDIVRWEIDSLVRYMTAHYPSVDPADTTSESEFNKYGFYLVKTKLTDCPDSTYAASTNVYLNYTGKLLNGRIFDTTVEKTAKDAGLYSSSTTYEPTYVTWAEDYTDMTLGSSASSTIDGFAYAISKMQPHEKATAIFYSGLGYGSSGSGDSISAYSPLIFEIELVDSED